jgi:16S rRNA G966 N2-methylase RsmD
MNYTKDELLLDWRNLRVWSTDSSMIHSTSRFGMKLCEHFFPNFYDIENAKGQSFSKLWTAELLKKVLRWNRKSHSTPYLSELKRGIYFCSGITKSTMYRPQMMKMACIRYAPNVVFDPCAGWGGRMLGAVSYGAQYIAFEPNTQTFENLNRLVDFLGVQRKVRLICDSALNMGKYDFPKVDMILTSPPYFDVEIYTQEKSQSITDHNGYTQWSEKFLRELVRQSLSLSHEETVSCWNVGKVGKHNMIEDISQYHKEGNFERQEVLRLVSSKRQMNQDDNKNVKSSDDTVVFARHSIVPMNLERFVV